MLLAVEQNKDATQIDAALVDQAAKEMIQKPLNLDAKLITQSLDPRNFVAHHKVQGAPAPVEVRRMATDRRLRLSADAREIQTRRAHLQTADTNLRQSVARVISNSRSA